MWRQVEADGREEQREGNGDRDNQRTAYIPQEEKQNHDDENDAFGQVVQHRVGRVSADRSRAIEEGYDLYASVATHDR